MRINSELTLLKCIHLHKLTQAIRNYKLPRNYRYISLKYTHFPNILLAILNTSLAITFNQVIWKAHIFWDGKLLSTPLWIIHEILTKVFATTTFSGQEDEMDGAFTHVEEMRNAYNISVGKPDEKKSC
jgi:hypothetical protein